MFTGFGFHIGVDSLVVIFLLTGPDQYYKGSCSAGAVDAVLSGTGQVEDFGFGDGL